MAFIKSRIAIVVVISLISLGAAYATLHSFSHGVVHDPARALHIDLNDAFAAHWKARTGVDVNVGQAWSKMGKPIHIMLDGLNVAALALSYGKKGQFIPPEWKPLPPNSPYASPYTSTVVFLVRKGNPKALTDWNDLLRSGVEVITPDPRISADGRWNYMAAWGYALKQPGSNEAVAFEFVRKLFANARSSDNDLRKMGREYPAAAFVEHDVGDVLLVWENEAHRLAQKEGSDKFEIIVPSSSIVAEPTISLVSGDMGGGRDVAAAYIDYLYTPLAQDIVSRHFFRPRDEHVSARYAGRFPRLELFTVDDVFGGWQKAQKMHFAKGGIFEQIQSN